MSTRHASQIVEGGCYQGSPLRPPRLRFRWIILAVLVVIIAVVAIAVSRQRQDGPVEMDLLDHIIRLMWMLVLTIWLASAYSSNEPVQSKRDWRSDAAVWVVSIAWVVLLIRRFDGPQIVPRLPLLRTVGSAVTVLGLVFALWSRFYLGRNWDAFITLKLDHKLIRKGPYAVVRHPIYAGFMLALIGTAVAIGHLRSFIAAVLVIAAWIYKSGLEEAFLIDHFGAEYEEYRHNVKRLIPYVW